MQMKVVGAVSVVNIFVAEYMLQRRVESEFMRVPLADHRVRGCMHGANGVEVDATLDHAAL